MATVPTWPHPASSSSLPLTTCSSPVAAASAPAVTRSRTAANGMGAAMRAYSPLYLGHGAIPTTTSPVVHVAPPQAPMYTAGASPTGAGAVSASSFNTSACLPAASANTSAAAQQAGLNPALAARAQSMGSGMATWGGGAGHSLPWTGCSWGRGVAEDAQQQPLLRPQEKDTALLDSLINSMKRIGPNGLPGFPQRATSAQRNADAVEFEEPCSTPATRSPTQRGQAASGLSICAEPAPSVVPSSNAAPMHAARQPAEVTLSVYYQRAVAFENGRVRTGMGGPNLSIGDKLWKTIVGIYHVGVAVRGVEYTFAMSRGYNSRRLGSPENGVFAHDAARAGPGNVLRESVSLGTTQLSAEQVEEQARDLGEGPFLRKSYNKIHHNCVDFAKVFCNAIGAQEPPSWSYRGANIAKTLGMGDQVQGADDAGDEGADAMQGAIEEASSAGVDHAVRPVQPHLPFAQMHQPVACALPFVPQPQLPQMRPVMAAPALPMQRQLQMQVRPGQVEVHVEVISKSLPAEVRKQIVSTEFDQDNVTEL